MKERWKWIKGYKGKYQISDYGRVVSFKKSIRSGKVSPFRIYKNRGKG